MWCTCGVNVVYMSRRFGVHVNGVYNVHVVNKCVVQCSCDVYEVYVEYISCTCGVCTL